MEGGKKDSNKAKDTKNQRHSRASSQQASEEKFYSEEYYIANYTTIMDDDKEKEAKQKVLEAKKARFPYPVMDQFLVSKVTEFKPADLDSDEERAIINLQKIKQKQKEEINR